MTTNGYSDIAEDDDETDNEITKLWYDSQLGEVLNYIPRGIGEWKTAGDLGERVPRVPRGISSPKWPLKGSNILGGIQKHLILIFSFNQIGMKHYFIIQICNLYLETKVTALHNFTWP